MTGQTQIAVGGRHVTQNKANPAGPGGAGLRIGERMRGSSKQSQSAMLDAGHNQLRKSAKQSQTWAGWSIWRGRVREAAGGAGVRNKAKHGRHGVSGERPLLPGWQPCREAIFAKQSQTWAGCGIWRRRVRQAAGGAGARNKANRLREGGRLEDSAWMILRNKANAPDVQAVRG